jgi:hypothetical protein
MRNSLTTFGLSLAFILLARASASATITGVSSDGCPGTTCLPSFVTPVVAGKTMSVLVKGQFVDLSTGVEVPNGGGVHASIGARQGGGNSSVEVRFDVDASAALGERTVKLHYAIETNGPDVFKIRVVRGGDIDKIEQAVNGLAPGTTRLIPADSIPVNQRITLVFTGSRLSNSQLAPAVAVTNPQTLSGCTETRCEIELEFTQAGNANVNLFDSDVPSAGNSLLYKFFYDGAKQVKVVGATSASTPPGAPFNHPLLAGGGGSGGLTDVAPRANVLNLFRRTGNSTTFEGQTFVQVEDRWCQENGLQTPATGSAAKLVTLPNIVWGVTNVGTAEIGVGFDAQLLANGQVLDTQNVAAGTLHPGATRDFTFHRARNDVRVFRFAPPNQTGCFAKPSDPGFFEDPPLTVRVDIGGTIAGENRGNNSRNY